MVSGRALFIKRKWGPERGCMLRVEADEPTTEAIIKSLPPGSKVEIACYNASSHHVVVGTGAATLAFEEAARSRDVSVKRLTVTHGFHSEMANCFMQEYHQILQGLALKRPLIPLEPCSRTPGSWDNVTPRLIARQSREPVYFGDSVARVEQRLGPCVWVEAGSGSAGVTMARRALPGHLIPSHSFHAARLDGTDPLASLAETTLGLWKEGVRVQFWLYHASQRSCFAPLEVPPYQFEMSQHWLPIVDRARGAGPGTNGSKPPRRSSRSPWPDIHTTPRRILSNSP